ncbi:MAG: hypothetical protein K2P70_19365 [Hyphomonadaceae bacterium]|jgi:hypothetical protein|nr:hypothetical protein [Hyphomonadaceae bacterium]
MAQTKFSAGQRVLAARGGVGAPAGHFQIVSVLPRDAGAQRYRVRGETENFERVIDEVRLEAVVYE